MSTIWEWAVYGLPWWAQAILALAPIAAIVLVIARLFGIRVALQVGGALLATLAMVAGRQQARQQGWNDRGERDAARARDRAEEREAIQSDVRNSSDADLDRRLRRWVQSDR